MLLRLFLLLLGANSVSDALRVKDNIRISLTNIENNCMRLLNGTHQIGCQSSREGNTGVVVHVASVENVRASGANLPWGLDQRIALVNANKMSAPLLEELRTNENIVGILMYRMTTEHFVGWSEDSVCPNQAFSIYSPQHACDWNKVGALSADGFQQLSYNKPIFILTNRTEIDILTTSCHNAFNKPDANTDYRCVARMQSFMFGAGDSRLCQERHTHSSLTVQNAALCDEIYDYNVLSVLPAVSANVSRANIIMLAARMDSFSVFHDSNGGDVSVFVSLIAALTVARSVGAQRKEFEKAARESNRQAAFAFFAAEALGYIGSTAAVYDMQQPTPTLRYKAERTAKHINLDDIGAFVELQHLAANHTTMYLHSDGQSAARYHREMAELQQAAERGARRLPWASVRALYDKPQARVPPASYQTFLRAKRIPGFVIAPFETQYETRVLNSFFDTQLSAAHNVERVRVGVLRDVELAGSIALQVLGEHVGGEKLAAALTLDRTFATRLVDCFIVDPNWACPLFIELASNKSFNASLNAHRTYGTFGAGYATVRELVSMLLTYALGDAHSATNIQLESECMAKNKDQDLYMYEWQREPDTSDYHCYRTSTYLQVARSPAFTIDGYDLRNDTYPTWMESRWELIELEVFLATGYAFEAYAAGVALTLLAASALLFRFLDESWFVDKTDVLPTDV